VNIRKCLPELQDTIVMAPGASRPVQHHLLGTQDCDPEGSSPKAKSSQLEFGIFVVLPEATNVCLKMTVCARVVKRDYNGVECCKT
jgi:hypothetical protein